MMRYTPTIMVSLIYTSILVLYFELFCLISLQQLEQASERGRLSAELALWKCELLMPLDWLCKERTGSPGATGSDLSEDQCQQLIGQ